MDEFLEIKLDGRTVLKMLACLRDGDRIGADRAVRGCVVQPDRTGARARFLDEASEIIQGLPLHGDEIDEATKLHAYRAAWRVLLKAERELELCRKKLDELHSSRR